MQQRMRDFVGPIAAAAAVSLCGTAMGQIETVTFTNVESGIQPVGPSSQRSFTSAGGYDAGEISISGTVSPIEAATWGSELRVRITHGSTTQVVTLGSGQTFPPNSNFSTATSAFDGEDAGGLWSFEFFDSYDDGSDGDPDALWSSITFDFDEAPPPGDPDVTLCEVYGLEQYGRVGSTVGLALATTSWNVGTDVLRWDQVPQETHPFIAMNMYRLQNDRFEQIGLSWLKHGFFALSNSQCGTGCQPNAGGSELGVQCTDTYGSSLNADQDGLGPRFEVNPWTGNWDYAGSMFQIGGPSNSGIRRRLQVQDSDLLAGGSFFAEAYYVAFDDENVMNSAAWKPVTPNGSAGSTWSFGMSGAGAFPNTGFAIDAWTGASQTVVAQELPIVDWNPNELSPSPDGRCILAYKATDNGNGTWHYEYAVMNIDMDRQVKSFSVPVPAGVNVSNVGFHAPLHHDEPVAYPGGPAIDNAPWTANLSGGVLEWSTASNPLRWGTLYNFRFDADAPPTDGQATFGMFKPGTPSVLTGLTSVPTPPVPNCPGDANGDNVVDINDLNQVIGNFGTSGPAGDVNGDNSVDINDVNQVLGNFGTSC